MLVSFRLQAETEFILPFVKLVRDQKKTIKFYHLEMFSFSLIT